MLCRGEDAKHTISQVASQQAPQAAAAKASAVKSEGVNSLLPYICHLCIMPCANVTTPLWLECVCLLPSQLLRLRFMACRAQGGGNWREAGGACTCTEAASPQSRGNWRHR